MSNNQENRFKRLIAFYLRQKDTNQKNFERFEHTFKLWIDLGTLNRDSLLEELFLEFQKLLTKKTKKTESDYLLVLLDKSLVDQSIPESALCKLLINFANFVIFK